MKTLKTKINDDYVNFAKNLSTYFPKNIFI